ncbi:amidohydrolase family protein [uncultured Allomuricauda sp.]|uniref:amidohydrolase family protein n=1 Tax=Flagellimonas sp. W118 TaxID=3410791 RepID=UPI00260F0458|nr:amidohydrolase family protein [uncultured Allomuricauda sp.]
MKIGVWLLIFILTASSCKTKSENTAQDETSAVLSDERSIKKIDVHSHYKFSREYLPALHQKWNMQSVLVDVSIEDSTGITRSWNSYLAHAQKHPDLFFLCSSLIGVGIDSPDFAEQAIQQLKKEIDSGARMVKVWKNFGMVTKDTSGHFIQIDDTRLQPVWDFLKQKNIPVMAHIGEPEQAWRPLDPNNPHYGYYKNNPQYHAYKIPEIPSYETIITARDKWIETNPDLRILCAHMGSMSHNIDMVAERLDKFPNMYVEPAARFGDLASQDSKKVKAFFEKYQDRILFGSDYGNSIPENAMTPDEIELEKTNLNDNYNKLWRYLSSSDSLLIRGQKTQGLELSEEVLDKIYYQNTISFLKLN